MSSVSFEYSIKTLESYKCFKLVLSLLSITTIITTDILLRMNLLYMNKLIII